MDKLAQNNVKPEHCMMRTYQQYTAALFLIPATLWAQSTLPPCHGSDPKRWHQCNGIYALQAGRYVGDFQNGKLHGTGTFHYKDGAKYIGDWREDKREGTGIYTQPSGNKYVGQWQAGKPHGRGTTAFANRTTFVGFYQEGKRNGEGILYAADGSVQGSGLWVNDDLTKSYGLDTSQFPLQRAR